MTRLVFSFLLSEQSCSWKAQQCTPPTTRLWPCPEDFAYVLLHFSYSMCLFVFKLQSLCKNTGESVHAGITNTKTQKPMGKACRPPSSVCVKVEITCRNFEHSRDKNPYSHVVDSSTSSVWSSFRAVTCLRRSPFHCPVSWLLAARCTHFLLFQGLLHLWRGKYIWKRNNAVVHARVCACVCVCMRIA